MNIGVNISQMKVISHRGNLNGANPARENTQQYIIDALIEGYDVEVDVWYQDGSYFLGHDAPNHKVDYCFLLHTGMWLHCKTVETLVELYKDIRLNVFFHEKDIAITSMGYLFTAPGLPLWKRSVAVMPEMSEGWDISDAYGVCTDYPLNYKRW
jgi:hypothetical protein